MIRIRIKVELKTVSLAANILFSTPANDYSTTSQLWLLSSFITITATRLTLIEDSAHCGCNIEDWRNSIYQQVDMMVAKSNKDCSVLVGCVLSACSFHFFFFFDILLFCVLINVDTGWTLYSVIPYLFLLPWWLCSYTCVHVKTESKNISIYL